MPVSSVVVSSAVAAWLRGMGENSAPSGAATTFFSVMPTTNHDQRSDGMISCAYQEDLHTPNVVFGDSVALFLESSRFLVRRNDANVVCLLQGGVTQLGSVMAQEEGDCNFQTRH